MMLMMRVKHLVSLTLPSPLSTPPSRWHRNARATGSACSCCSSSRLSSCPSLACRSRFALAVMRQRKSAAAAAQQLEAGQACVDGCCGNLVVVVVVMK